MHNIRPLKRGKILTVFHLVQIQGENHVAITSNLVGFGQTGEPVFLGAYCDF
jgi:hypothetical protein